jgi:ABC-2 type transport system ATP-binding protein
MAENAIKVSGVFKNFKLPHERTSSIKSGIVNVFRKRSKRITTQHALRNINFEVKEGEFFGIVGRNGSGKSTLLKILAEIYQPTKGEVSVNGKLVPFIELGVGFNPELTGRENVYLNGALLGFSKKEIDARYDDIVEFAELKDFMDQKLKNYSSGMQVRLAFSVATRAEADILLVDEVLAVGDANFQRKCYEYFKSLKKSRKTVVFVTHDMNAVREYCDRAVLIEDSKLIFEGKAADVANEYLRQFNQFGDKTLDQKPSKNRWGTRDVYIKKHKITVTEESITVDLDMQCGNKAVDDFVIGYRFIDKAGKLVAGANNKNVASGSQVLSMAANSKMKVSFTSENIIGNGTFEIWLTVRSNDNTTIYDSIDRAADTSVVRLDAGYPVVLPSTLTVTK